MPKEIERITMDKIQFTEFKVNGRIIKFLKVEYEKAFKWEVKGSLTNGDSTWSMSKQVGPILSKERCIANGLIALQSVLTNEDLLMDGTKVFLDITEVKKSYIRYGYD